MVLRVDRCLLMDWLSRISQEIVHWLQLAELSVFYVVVDRHKNND